MKKLVFLTLIAALLVCACAGPVLEQPAGTPSPEVAPAASPQTPADVSGLYTMNQRTVLYPEGASEETAEYRLCYSIPVFAGFEAAEAMNAALTPYEEELVERVLNERMPYADRVEGEPLPETAVETTVTQARGYTNIRFDESFGFGESRESAAFTLVLDGAGRETNFAAASDVYSPEELAAQQVWNVIDREDPDRKTYFGDIDTTDIALKLDLYNGFLVTEEGFTLLFAPGAIREEALGVTEISFPASALYPEFAGEVMSEAAYEALIPALDALCCACGPQYESFWEDGPTALAASGFMTALLGGGSVPKAEYETLYASYFAAPLPADLVENGNGTYVEGDAYILPDLPGGYRAQLSEAVESSGTLTLTGTLMYGEPGSADATVLGALSIGLAPSDSPAGYSFVSFEIR